MKLLIDLRLLTKGGTTGIEEYTIQIVKNFLAAKNENEYIFFYNGLRKALLPGKLLNDARISLVDWSIPNKLLDMVNYFFDRPKLDLLLGADAIFSPHFNIISHSQKTPHVMTFHDLSFIHHPEFFPPRKKIWHWLQKYRDRAGQASRLIAVSEFTKWDLVEELGIEPEKISVVHSGIDAGLKPLRRAAPEVKAFAEKFGLRRPFLLYLGTVEPRKNVGAAIRAFNIMKSLPGLSDWQLVIAGNLGWLYQGVLREAARSPYRSDIRFLGPVDAADKVFLYNLAEIFIYPSFFEGFGFPPLEAQACGVPVVAADRTSLPEILGDSAVLVNPWKVDDIVSVLRELALDGVVREMKIRAGLENVKRFSWEEAARKTLAILASAG